LAEWRARQTRRESSRAITARGLRFLRTGQWGSKPAALDWTASLGCPAVAVIAELARALAKGV